jgi:uncharacterized membrane protein
VVLAHLSVPPTHSPFNPHVMTVQKLALPAAAFMAAALMFASTPDAAEAARSGGRMGGSSFSSRPRSAPSRAPSRGPSGGGGGVRNYNYYSAPPIISPFGGYGMGYGGYGMGGGGLFLSPVFGIGSLFNIFILMIVANVVLSTIRNFTNKDDKDASWKDKDDDDKW